ncbi:MAG: TIGR03758 family integrating conjugative element protein [Thiothrix sp.]|nr:MAG: TIGR03758 family integrating conjugative element protein [Thiothrix sp.]
MSDLATSFQAGSGIDPAKLYTLISSFLLASALVWSMWVIWRTWKAAKLKKLSMADAMGAWVTAIIIIAFLGILLVY